MAYFKGQTCDVQMTATGALVLADEKVEVTIPSVLTGTGKPKRVTLDVSEKGSRDLAKMVSSADAELERAAAKAYEPILAIVAKHEEINGTGRRRKKEDASGSAPQPEVTNDDAGDDGESNTGTSSSTWSGYQDA